MKKWYLPIVIIGLVILAALYFLTSHRGKVKNDETFNSEGLTKGVDNFKTEATAQSQMKLFLKAPEPLDKALIEGKMVNIGTAKGEVRIQLFSDVPQAASNFIFLVNEGFYNGLTFHRRVEGFVIQGGDPRGDGTGGPGYKFEDEPVTRDYKRGIVAMANSGPNTNGSQFFIMLADTPLSKDYTIFGEVVSGMDVVDQIAIGDIMEKVSVE